MLSIQPKIAVLNVPGFVSKKDDMLDYARDLCPNADVEWIDKADISPYVTSNLGPACPQHDSGMIAQYWTLDQQFSLPHHLLTPWSTKC